MGCGGGAQGKRGAGARRARGVLRKSARGCGDPLRKGGRASAFGGKRGAQSRRVRHGVDQLAHDALIVGGEQGVLLHHGVPFVAVAVHCFAEKLFQRNIHAGADGADGGQRRLVVPRRHHGQCGLGKARTLAQLRNIPASCVQKLLQAAARIKFLGRACHTVSLLPVPAGAGCFKRIPYYTPPHASFASYFFTKSEVFCKFL